MVMDTLQIRISHETLDRIDRFIKTGEYSSRSDVIRDAVRRFVWDKEVGTISYKGNAVKAVRQARKVLSKENMALDDINNLTKL
jgi:Arc/MetJ-type ribon-helix-helix transcriptional regulator